MDFEATQPLRPPPQQLRFHGSGAAYFRIWIVNLLLTIVTLGIYGAWAKVRRLQYFYRNTELAGSSFEYWGNPIAILKGRIIAVVLLLLYRFGFQVSRPFGILVLVVLAVALPLLLRSALRFRMRNSGYRGLRFSFHGSVGQAYAVFLPGFLVAFAFLLLVAPYEQGVLKSQAANHGNPVAILGLLALLPLTLLAAAFIHWLLKRYQHGQARFGRSAFTFDAKPASFVFIYLKTGGLMFMIGFVLGLLSSSVTALHLYPGATTRSQRLAIAALPMLLLLLAAAPLYIAYFSARIQNLIWNHTRLDAQRVLPHRFEYKLSVRRLYWIYLGNVLLTLLSLGFYYPWAMVRLARYRIESMTLVPGGPLDAFVAGEAEEPGAIGEEAAGVFDIDLSF